MAIFRSRTSALFLLLLVLLFHLPPLFPGRELEKRRVHGADMGLNSHRSVLKMKSLVPASTCNPPPTERVGSLPLVHRQGPCSPLLKERLQRCNSTLINLRDQSRINSIRRSLASSSSSSSSIGNDLPGTGLRIPVVGHLEGAGEYVVTVGLGTPRRDLPVIFDTGSPLTWTHCLPCPTQGCCPQNDRCFEPSKSSTYSNPPCPPNCNYSVFYADKSFSNGFYVQDTLTLNADYTFPNFIFGCGQNNSDGFGTSTGILGLALGDHSLISQTTDTFAQIFCYCIPPTYNRQGYLLFGFGALQQCQTNQYTSILSDQTGSFQYFIKLLGITTGKQTLNFSELAPLSSPSRTIIDSGTTISRLPSSVYLALRDEFKKEMSEYPVAQHLPSLGLDTCYNLEGHENVTLPKVVLNFDGTDVNVDPSGVVWRESDSQVCFAFAAKEKEDDLTIIGSTQQRNLNILYNIQANKVEFGTGSCGS
ncbi:aspartyl protease AED1-like [Punica granatum]|uniref:Peptidase A1 domain-containing protein n=2 Tax=Punica granatum TaxID=22663 RepID=A0A218WSS0_PUNGR|nr:aspartyl protease AED1-like [Punica granatum]OWM75835.1 hypothetical protein CDL15_Pgr009479 [Punica granatum]PKH47845.1 hypothetical protein CRG98_050421 [Punica granatum]